MLNRFLDMMFPVMKRFTKTVRGVVVSGRAGVEGGGRGRGGRGKENVTSGNARVQLGLVIKIFTQNINIQHHKCQQTLQNNRKP